jgi:hypothetical protein
VPILVRPVREQLEHDRVIRLLEAKYRRKFHVDINPGDERKTAVKAGPVTLFPDLVLSDESGRKPYAVVEVETGESVNHLEAMSQWANLAKSKAYLYLYVPAGSVDSARRLCADHQIEVTELASYLSIGDQVRFTTVSRVPTPEPVEKREKKTAEKPAPDRKPTVEKAERMEKVAVAEKLAKAPKSENGAGAKPQPVAKVAKMAPPERAAKPEKKIAVLAKKAPRPAATPKRGAGEAAGRRVAQPAKRVAVKRAAASRTATRSATKRAPARTAKPQPKAVRAQKRK